MKKYFSILLLLFAVSVSAQTFHETVKQTLIKEWVRAKAYTDEYLAAMPADDYGKKPVDSIRSFAEQMLHLASGNAGLISTATGTTSVFAGRNLEKSESAKSKDSVTYLVDKSYEFAVESIKALDASKLEEVTGRGTLKETRLTWLLKAFEHQTHHRGQTTIYIRLQGIRPPNERLF